MRSWNVGREGSVQKTEVFAGRRNHWQTFGHLYLGLIFIFTYLPVVLVVVYSFNTGRFGVWHGFTTDWYVRLFNNRSLHANLQNSLIVAFTSVALAIGIGTAGAVGLARSHFKGKQLVESLAIAPLLLPEIILGMAYLTLFSGIGIRFGYGTMIVAHMTFCIPYIFLNVQSRLAGLDPHLVEAARDLGASSGRAFRDITLPLIAPAIFSGALLAFAMSMDDVVITFFVAGVGTDTLPLRIYSLTRIGITPEIYALCTLMLVVIVFCILGYMGVDRVRRLRALRH